jgi:hypothetical protein
MINPYIQYYNNQVGTGLPVFQGVRTQKGHGFFGRIIGGIGSFIKSLAPGLLSALLPSATGLAQDVIEGKNFKDSAKSRLVDAGKSAANTTLDHIKTKIQGGSGISRLVRRKRKYRNRAFTIAPTRKKARRSIRKRKSYNSRSKSKNK